MRLGAYIHIPFCEGKCGYCAFYSVSAGDDKTDTLNRYCERLIDEMRARIPRGNAVLFDTVYFGGGTPSLLGPENISLLISSLSELGAIEPGAEISLETNPCHLGAESVSAFINAGINRIVAGVQSFDSNFLSLIGRTARDYDIETVKSFFSRDDVNRSIDIICGPDLTAVAADCRAALEFKPDHISFYMLSVEEGTPLSKTIEATPEFELGLAESFENGIDILKAGGYEHYEISNLSLPGKRSRHNMKYWQFEPYIGFGPSSHSFVNGMRCCNGMTAESYLKGPIDTPIPDLRNPGQAAAEFVMTAIRLTEGFSVEALRERLGHGHSDKVLAKMPALVGGGYLYPDEKNIRLTRKGILWSDMAAYSLVEDLI